VFCLGDGCFQQCLKSLGVFSLTYVCSKHRIDVCTNWLPQWVLSCAKPYGCSNTLGAMACTFGRSNKASWLCSVCEDGDVGHSGCVHMCTQLGDRAWECF
jgi:hypothetical protein